MTTLTEPAEAVLHEMAYSHYEAGKYEQASHLFRFLTLASPIDARYWFGLGSCLMMLQEYAEALQCFELAALYDEDNVRARDRQAECRKRINSRNL